MGWPSGSLLLGVWDCLAICRTERQIGKALFFLVYYAHRLFPSQNRPGPRVKTGRARFPAHEPASRATFDSEGNRSPEHHRPADMADEGKHLETGRADRSVWLMKCPTIVSRAWQEAAAAAADAGGPNPNPNPVVAKVILSFDPLSTDEDPNQARVSPIAPVCVALPPSKRSR